MNNVFSLYDCYTALANNDYTASLIINTILEADYDFVKAALLDLGPWAIQELEHGNRDLQFLMMLETAGVLETEARQGMLMVYVDWLEDRTLEDA